MKHYTYKVYNSSGKYYVGRHSTTNIDDGYIGSGRWVRQIKDKESLTKEILSFYDSFEELIEAEQYLISSVIDDPLNMNFNNNAVGFACGSLNPSCSELSRQRNSDRLKQSNPMKNGHSVDSKKKISSSMKGRFVNFKHTDETRKNMSEARKKFRYSDEQKKKMSDTRKGIKPSGLTFSGKNHSKETLQKMSLAAKSRPKIVCQHCNTECAVNTYSRWHGDKCKNNISV